MKEQGFFARWRANFFTGLAVVLPALISIAVVVWLFGTVANFTDRLLFFLPQKWTHQDNGTGPVYWYWSWVAFAVAVALVTLLGRATRHYVGKKLIEWADRLLLQIPLLNKIYGMVKQVNDALSSNKSSFKQVVLVEFPNEGSWAMGFITSDKTLSPREDLNLLTVFIPTTPNPTSGFLVLVPESKLTRLDIPVAEGIRFIISIGSIPPDQQAARIAALRPSA
jgi:uncharacterized membrane protein